MNKQNDSVEKSIKTNNQLRKKLTDENREYYEQLLVYIRSAGLFYDDYEIENLLLQILQDIISAQEDGQSAEGFFGKSPQLAADELIHNLGKSSRKEILKLVGLVFGISSFFELLSTLTSSDRGINLLVLIKLLVPHTLLTIHLSNTFAILVIAIMLIGSLILVFIRSKKDERMWWPFLPFIWILGLIGIASRLPMTESWMSSSDGKITAAVLTGFGFILFWGLTYLYLREKKE